MRAWVTGNGSGEGVGDAVNGAKDRTKTDSKGRVETGRMYERRIALGEIGIKTRSRI